MDEADSYWGNKHRPFVKIGAGRDELGALADAIVRGASIAHAEIADLRTLIDVVQAHPQARVATIGPNGRPTDKDPTELWIHGGIVRSCLCSGVDIGVTLGVSTSFAGEASFSEASFAGEASFHGASFAGDADFSEANFTRDARFSQANFTGDANFSEANFTRDARFFWANFAGRADFPGASFAGDADFSEANFAGDARFFRASFTGEADFSRASFADEADFPGASFAGEADFNHASFAGKANFFRARFTGVPDFSEARFTGVAVFSEAHFARLANFPRAHFAGEADFNEASFAGEASFSEASFAGEASFHGASFAGGARFPQARFSGKLWLDARRIDLRTVRFAEQARRAIHVIARKFGWTTVRGIGQLGILTRVSVIALIAVPVLAGVWPALRVAVNRYNRAVTEAAEEFNDAAERLEAATNPISDASAVDRVVAELRSWAAVWRDRFGGLTMDEPSLSDTLALAFFAAVCVTLGQILYQVFASQTVRGQDEDQFVQAFHSRYPEGAPDRNDGLRRATDALATMAKRRPDRHANLVDHHGETVWIPPTTRIDWFSDPQEEPAPPEGGEQGEGGEQHTEPGRAKSPQGTIPAAERARIALEEGARAEYWLAGREKLGWAWASFVLYTIAMLLLLYILLMQCYRVGKAAEWWAQAGPSSSSNPAMSMQV